VLPRNRREPPGSDNRVRLAERVMIANPQHLLPVEKLGVGGQGMPHKKGVILRITGFLDFVHRLGFLYN
jgi:hypothetical protein